MYREWDIRNYRNYHGTGADSAVSLRVRDPPPTQGLTFKVKPERKAGWAALEGHNRSPMPIRSTSHMSAPPPCPVPPPCWSTFYVPRSAVLCASHPHASRIMTISNHRVSRIVRVPLTTMRMATLLPTRQAACRLQCPIHEHPALARQHPTHARHRTSFTGAHLHQLGAGQGAHTVCSPRHRAAHLCTLHPDD